MAGTLGLHCGSNTACKTVLLACIIQTEHVFLKS